MLQFPRSAVTRRLRRGTIMRQDQESVDKCMTVVDIVLLALTGGILALPFLMRENKDGPWLVERRNAA